MLTQLKSRFRFKGRYFIWCTVNKRTKLYRWFLRYYTTGIQIPNLPNVLGCIGLPSKNFGQLRNLKKATPESKKYFTHSSWSKEDFRDVKSNELQLYLSKLYYFLIGTYIHSFFLCQRNTFFFCYWRICTPLEISFYNYLYRSILRS